MLSNSEDIVCNNSIKLKNDLRPVLIACCITGAVSAFTCILAITLIVVFRMYKLLTNRIILYLLVGSLFFCLATVFLILALWQNYWKGEHYKWCVAEGFFIGYSELVMLFSTLMVTLHLTLMVLHDSYYKKITTHTWCTCTILDVVYLLFSWILPLIIACIPFVHNNYGLSGPWCWIRLYNDDCSWNKEGMREVYGTFYVELALGLILNDIALAVVLLTLCKRSCHNNTTLDYCKALKQTLPLIFFPIIYQVLSWIALANRIYQSAYNGKYVKELFFAHAVTAAGWGFFAGLFAIIYLVITKKLIKMCQRLKKTVVNTSVTEREHLISEDMKDRSYGNTMTDPTTCPLMSESYLDIENEQIH